MDKVSTILVYALQFYLAKLSSIFKSEILLAFGQKPRYLLYWRKQLNSND